jgi:acyl-CoA thioester hydrolase
MDGRQQDFSAPDTAYRHELRVQASDIDEFGHANNVVWVRWVNEAAFAHACSVGLGPDASRALDAIWVVRKHAIDYLWPAFEGQRVDCVTWPHTVQGATSLRRTLFLSEGRVLAHAETTWALLRASTGRPRRIPLDMMQAYGFTQEQR